MGNFIYLLCFLSLVNATITSFRSDEQSIILASRDLNRPQSTTRSPLGGSRARTPSPSTTTILTKNRKSNGFNLLWLISSRIHHRNYLRNQVRASASRTRTSSRYSRRMFRHGVPLHSNLPKNILRYYRTFRNFNVMRRRMKGKHIGFETQFRLSPSSGSGYLITGRSVGGRRGRRGRRLQARKSRGSSSWFGLFSKVYHNGNFKLQLEYRDSSWATRGKLSIPLHERGFALGQWHNLTVQINFARSRIDCWVNCTHVDSIKIHRTRTRPSTHFHVYRLLQHRNASNTPVQVSFKSMVITDGSSPHHPKQCVDNYRNSSSPVCRGGHVYMECGPSCGRTCGGRPFSLNRCTLNCVRGCHCPSSQVDHNGVCINPELCPCRIGTKVYRSGAIHTINNQICTCTTGRWKCYAVASISRSPRSQVARVGTRLNMTCAVTGNPLPRIHWKYPRGAHPRIVGRTRISKLFIANVTHNAAGLYTCLASRSMGNWSDDATARVKVISLPTIKPMRKTLTVMSGTPVTNIDCEIKGIPTPRAAWMKNRAKLPSHLRPSGVLRLKIFNMNTSHAGEYKCVAKNTAGYATRSVRVLVEETGLNNMAIRRRPRDRCVKSGHSVVFHCEAIDHDSRVNVTWYKDAMELQGGDRRFIKRPTRLVIRKVTRSDAGLYKCKIAMTTGNMEAHARLMIKGRMLPWSSWSECTKSCGSGFKLKRRRCTGVPQNERTCHGRFNVTKICNAQICPGVCSSYGDPHYTTFDGRTFNFQGDCSYILSQDVSGNTFKIIQDNIGCGSRLSCIQKLSVILSMPNFSVVVDLGRDHTVLFNGVPLALPFHAPSANFSIVQMGLYLMLQVGDYLEIRWATPHRLYVVISGMYYERTQGLCGNFNGNPDDDKLSPQGRRLKSDLEFGQSWAVKDGNTNFSCHAVRTIHNPCTNRAVTRQAKDTCLYLTDRSLFGKCHNVLHPGPYIRNCMLDICSTSLAKTNLYFCIALSAYSEDCLRHGVELNWRTEELCPVRCPRGMTYSECGPTCLRHCPSRIDGGSVCLSKRKCVSGCFCPEDTVHHNGRCIPLSECPCQFNGMVFAYGSRHERNCQQCVCTNGDWECEFNGRLCAFPASVTRSPHSQVVTFGQSVSLCCGVTGIPSPTVEWYFEGVKLNSTGPNNASFISDSLNSSTLVIHNISMKDLGLYICKASNSLGSHMSTAASLYLYDPEAYVCRPTPSVNRVILPDGCYVTSNEGRENFVNLGRCSGAPCYAPSNGPNRVRSCNPLRLCCQASATSPLLVRCRHQSYITSFLITIVRECSCVVCSEKTTVVEGVVKSARTHLPVRHVMLSHQGRTVGYTSGTGSFRIKFQNLPVETQHVTITVTDVILKRYTTTVKNLAVLSGQSTLHTIFVHPCDDNFEFNTSHGLHRTFRVSDRHSHRMKLTIPPNSLVYDSQRGRFSGRVVAGVTLIDHNRHLPRGQWSLPENPVAIGLNGNELLISPSVTLYVTLWCWQSRRRVDLAPGKFATLSVVSYGIGAKLQTWAVDDFTGLWRENKDKLMIEPRYKKNGDKILLATARISRLKTAWSLAVAEDPCYLRAKVVDPQNVSVPGVKISFTTANIRSSSVNSFLRRYKRNRKPLFSSSVEYLTGSRNYPNGVCLPVGCHATGMLQASRLGNELVLLEPDAPSRNMGRVEEMRVMVGKESVFHNVSESLDTSQVYHTKNMSSHYAYFHNKEECRNINPSLHTYVFRDGQHPQDGSAFSRHTMHNNVILTIGMPRQGTSSPKPLLKYCHVKVLVRSLPSFTYNRPLQIEVITYRNKTTRSRNTMSFLGWRTVVLDTHPHPPGVVVNQYVCVEYLCGEMQLTDKEQLVLRVTIRGGGDNVSSFPDPPCSFYPVPPDDLPTNHRMVANNYFQTPQRSGYLYVHKMFNIRNRSYRTVFHREIRDEFSAATLAESKQRCASSPPTENVSAYFNCV